MARRAPKPKKKRVLWILLSLVPLAGVIGYRLGRAEAVPESPPIALLPPECPEVEKTLTQQSRTSTIGLCPCPRPRPAKVLPISRKKVPPKTAPDFDRPDPTAATAKYLRDQADKLAVCAPQSGGEVKVHLEVDVAPKGEVARVAVTNLDPLPGDVTSCVERVVRGLQPPGFDSTETATFALTVVL